MIAVLKRAIHVLLMQQGQFDPLYNTQQKPVELMADPGLNCGLFILQTSFILLPPSWRQLWSLGVFYGITKANI